MVLNLSAFTNKNEGNIESDNNLNLSAFGNIPKPVETQTKQPVLQLGEKLFTPLSKSLPPLPKIPTYTPSIEPFKNVLSGLTPTKDLAEKTKSKFKYPEGPKVKVDYYDLLNIIPQIAGEIAGPIYSGASSLNETAFGKPLPKITIPAVGPKRGEEFAPESRSRGNLIDTKSTIQEYNDEIAKGVSEKDAYHNAIIKTFGDITALVTAFAEPVRNVAKYGVSKTNPTALIEPTITTQISRDDVRNYLIGRTPEGSTKFNLSDDAKKFIAETLKTGTRQDKNRLLGGIDVLDVKPSRLGKILGLSQEEADAILKTTYGGPVRQTSVAALPGYAPIGEPQPKIGGQIQPVQRVGGEYPVEKAPTYTETGVDNFIKSKGLEPDSVLPLKGESFDRNNLPEELKPFSNNVVENTAGNKSILADLPIAKFGKPEFTTLNQNKYKSGQKITSPIEATYNPETGEYTITDGANRFTQAVANGDKTIATIVDFEVGGKPIKKEGVDRTVEAGLSQNLPAKEISTPIKSQLLVYKETGDITLKTLQKLEGRSSVSKTFISDLTNSGDIKQPERDAIRKVLNEYPEGNIPVKEFTDKVKAELLPLERVPRNPRYENISLPEDQRGMIGNYGESTYESPIKTSAGSVHNFGTENYFAHIRYEDLAKSGGRKLIEDKNYHNKVYPETLPGTELSNTRRVIEIQSDLFQKGRLEGEVPSYVHASDYLPPEKLKEYNRIEKRLTDLTFSDNSTDYKDEIKTLQKQRADLEASAKDLEDKVINSRKTEIAKLEPYRNTWQDRIIREEIKQAAKDGKTKLQFPTGETAMKIEGLGQRESWRIGDRQNGFILNPEMLNSKMIGEEVTPLSQAGDTWIITDVLGDGKFKAMPIHTWKLKDSKHMNQQSFEAFKETFDISGKVDTNNPIYKFYEKEVGRYLQKFGAKRVIDAQGVTWNEVPVQKEAATQPVVAYKKPSFSKLQGNKITTEKARELFKDLLNKYPDKRVHLLFDENLLKERGALGIFTPSTKESLSSLIELYTEGNMTTSQALYHEAGHFIFKNYVPKERRIEILNHAEKEMGLLKKLDYRYSGYKKEEILEEYVMDQYAKYKSKQAGFSSTWEKIFDYIDQAIKKIIDTIKDIGEKWKKFVEERGGSQKGSADFLEPRKKITDTERLVAEGKIKIKESDGKKIFQYIENGKWITALNESHAVTKAKGPVEKPIIEETPPVKEKPTNFSETKGGVIDLSKPKEIPEDLKKIAEALKNQELSQQQFEKVQEMISQAEMRIEDMPGKKLIKFVSKKEGEFLDFQNPFGTTFEARSPKEVEKIRERNKKVMRVAESAFSGMPDISNKFDDADVIREQIDKYVELRDKLKEFKQIASELRSDKALVRKGEELMQMARGERRSMLRAIRDKFDLTDQDIAHLRGGRDIMSMTEPEYQQFLYKIGEKAEHLEKVRNARIQIKALIEEKQFRKFENLQKAMKLPDINKMTLKQLETFDAELSKYQFQDEFLTQRQLETINKTDFAGIKTIREGKEKLSKKLEGKFGVENPNLNIEVSGMDRFRWDTALAEKNIFYKYFVEGFDAAILEGDYRLHELNNEVNDLFRKSRKGTGIVNKLIPQDERIWQYGETPDTEKADFAKNMSGNEIETAKYIDEKLKEAYNYELEQQMLHKSRFEGMYMPHVQRSFLEMVRDGGMKTLFKELFQQFNIDKRTLTILDQKTGDILPYEKFFRFAMKRTGEIVPTKNVARAFMTYMRAFERKRALDKIIPEIMTSVNIVSPRATTEKGLVMDDSLERFVKEYINNKKGRKVTKFIQPGSLLDVTLHSVKALTQILDLGLNIPLQIGSQGGVHTTAFIGLGAKKYGLGVKRLASKRGKDLVSNYENFTGKTPFNSLIDTSKDIGNKTHDLMFALFKDAAVRGNKIYLLGSLKEGEWMTGKISPERLAEIKTDMGRWMPVEGTKSIYGSTSEGSMLTQYRSWAFPILRTAVKDGEKLIKMVASGEFKKAGKSREFWELFRGVQITAFVALLALAVGYDSNKKDSELSFADKIIKKSIQDALSIVGSFDPSTWQIGLGRVPGFFSDFMHNLSDLVRLVEYKTSGKGYNKGDLKGVNELQRQFTPVAVKDIKQTISGTGNKKNPLGGIPKLPKLPKLPSLPKLPKI